MANKNERLKVLVADDEPSTLALVANHMRSKGYDVVEATDGDAAWELAHEHLPDLVLLDVMMPGMSGWEVCRKIRETVSLAHTGVIMLTGIGENLNEMTSPLYGADAYVDKPFEFSSIDAKVKETFARRSEGQQARAPDASDDDLDLDDESDEEPEKVSASRVAAALNRVLGDERSGRPARASARGAKKAKTKAQKAARKTKARAKKAARKTKAAAKKTTRKTKAAAKKATRKTKAAAKKATQKTKATVRKAKKAERKTKAAGKKAARKSKAAAKKAARKTKAAAKKAARKTKAAAKKAARKTKAAARKAKKATRKAKRGPRKKK